MALICIASLYNNKKQSLLFLSLLSIYIIDYNYYLQLYRWLDVKFYIFIYFIFINFAIAISNFLVYRKNSVVSLIANSAIILIYLYNITVCLNNDYNFWRWLIQINFPYYVALIHVLTTFEIDHKKIYDRIINIFMFLYVGYTSFINLLSFESHKKKHYKYKGNS